MMTPPSVERVVLRAAVGHDNYGDVERLVVTLDRLERRGALTEGGVGAILVTLAEEMVAAALLRDELERLSSSAPVVDTPTPEDPTS